MPKVGLICATKYELPEITPYRNSKHIQIYNIGDFNIGIIISDVGPENAKTATRILYLDYNPDWIIAFGICGGSQSELAIGDIIVADKIHFNGNEIAIKCPQLEVVKTCLSNNLIKYHVGKLQTFDHPVLSRKEVSADVLGVDMESYQIVDEATKLNIPSIIIKSVSDILPDRKPFLIPKMRLSYRISKNLVIAMKGLNDFSNKYFTSHSKNK